MVKIYFDGGSRGNPGKAAGAAIIDVQPKLVVAEYMNGATNNEAEYTGLIVGLKKALELGLDEVAIYGDSNLVVSQIRGEWAVKTKSLLPFYNQAKSLLRQFKQYQISWIPRAQNKQADAAANECMDRRASFCKRDGLRKAGEDQIENQKSKIENRASESPAKIKGNTLADQVQQIIQAGNKARFKDFTSLKSGNDQYSRLKLTKLQELVPEQAQQAIASAWLEVSDEYLAKCLRWHLRGLPPDLAVRKCKTDLEMTAKTLGCTVEEILGIEPGTVNLEGQKPKPETLSQFAEGLMVKVTNPKLYSFGKIGTVLGNIQVSATGRLMDVEIDGKTLTLKESDLKEATVSDLK